MANTKGTFRGETKRIKVTPTAKITCGTFVIVGGLVGVATEEIAANTEGEIQIEGDYDLPIASASAAVGDVIRTTVSTTAAGDVAGFPVGIALQAISSGTLIRIKLVPNYCTYLPTYSALGAYAVGDLVINSGKVYRCKTAISAAEAFTAAKWDQIATMATVTTTPAS